MGVHVIMDLVRINNLGTVPNDAFDDLDDVAAIWGDTPFFSLSATQLLSLQMDCSPDSVDTAIDQMIEAAQATRDFWSPEALGQNL